MTDETHPARLHPKRSCPLCGKPSQEKYHPFCSVRCANVDLNRWLVGQYAIAAEEEPDPGDDPPPEKDG